MFCHACGKQVPDGALFCMHCGTKLPPITDSGEYRIAHPLQPEVISPAPISSEPMQPEVVSPVPISSEPMQPEVVSPVPISSEPMQPEVVSPTPISSEPMQPEVVSPTPISGKPARKLGKKGKWILIVAVIVVLRLLGLIIENGSVLGGSIVGTWQPEDGYGIIRFDKDGTMFSEDEGKIYNYKVDKNTLILTNQWGRSQIMEYKVSGKTMIIIYPDGAAVRFTKK